MSVLALSRHGRTLSDISRASKQNTVQLDEHRSFLSRFLVLWVGPLLTKGSRTSLVYEDLPGLKQKHRSPELLRHFKPDSKSSLLWNLLCHYKCGIFLSILTKLGSQILDYINPLLLSLLINENMFLSKVPPLTHGISIAVLIFIVSELKSVLLTAHAYIDTRDAALSMSILSNSIVKKSLKLSMESRNEWTSSRISNLVTVDLEAIAVTPPFAHFLWAAVVEVCIALAFIYHTIGTPGVGAIIVMVSYVPANILVSRVVRILQVKQMEWKDRRVNFTKEVIMGLKMVKVFAWEKPFEEEIRRIRSVELTFLQRQLLISRVLQALNSSAPFIVPIVCFTWFVLVNPPGSLTPQVAFVCLVIFNMLRRPMANVSPSIQYVTKALVSLRRIDEFLSAPELQQDKHPDNATEPQHIHIALKNSYFTWKAEKEHLSDITLEIQEGGFQAVVGPVGSGKSSVLSAVTGDLILLDGVRSVHGTLAYVPQVPWIMNCTIKANILYGKEFDKLRYDKVTKACELRKDFYAMPRYDSTVVGDNGMALSGGQRARIALARALYQDADIYLLDDPFSALDPSVRKAVFDAVLGPKGLLAKKTILLATHDISLVKTADICHVIDEGKIEASGEFEELCESSDLFNELRRETERSVAEQPKEPEAPKKKKPKAVMFEPPELPDETKNEVVKQGKVNSSVYMTYLRAFSFHWAACFILLLAFRYFLQGCSGMWLSTWADHNSDTGGTDTTRQFFLHIYVALGAGTVLVSVLAFVFSTFGGVRASAALHEPLIASLIRAPMSFFETTPFGRILNRFTGDMDIVDNPLPINLRLSIDCLLNMGMVLVVISVNIPAFLLFVVPFIAAYAFLLKRFVAPTRQIRRIESAKRSSLLSSITEVVAGASSIRAFGRVKMTCLQLQQDVDAFTRCRYLQPATQRWLSLRMELLGNIMIFICAIMVTVFHYLGWISVGSMGLCISYALTLTETMNFSVKMMVLSETNIVAVERIKEYHEITPEGSWTSDYPLIEAWPHTGSIDVRKLNVRYGGRVGAQALQDVTFSIKGGERIGIVGRTGSGKSSLVTALLRLIEANSGDIKIDGVNTSEIGLHQLRSRITFIPQEPVLFSSSLRFNLDPFNEYADSDLWLALEACQLKDVVRKSKAGLHWHLEEGGANLSVGERQLVCLCRALLKGGQVLILDEATAAVDRPTERLLHQVVCDFFKHSTTLIVAHRLETIEHCDRLLVLDEGRVLDFDTPKALMEKTDSLFRELAQVD